MGEGRAGKGHRQREGELARVRLWWLCTLQLVVRCKLVEVSFSYGSVGGQEEPWQLTGPPRDAELWQVAGGRWTVGVLSGAGEGQCSLGNTCRWGSNSILGGTAGAAGHPGVH